MRQISVEEIQNSPPLCEHLESPTSSNDGQDSATSHNKYYGSKIKRARAK